MQLTPAQKEILPYLAADLTTREIGLVLGKDERTIRGHLRRAYARNEWTGPHAAVLAFTAEGGKPKRISKARRRRLAAATS